MTIALMAAALGLPAALFLLWPLRRRGGAPPVQALDGERVALEAEKTSALRAIRELELDREAGHLAEDDYADLRARGEAQAAAILRRLDELGPAPEAQPAAAGRDGGGRPSPAVPWTRLPVTLAAAAVALLGFGVLLGMLVTRFTAPAPPDPAGAAMAAAPGAPGMPPPGPAVPDAPPGGGGGRPITPEMLQGMLQAAHASLDAGRYQEAIAAYKAVLKRLPENVDAITHLGVILALAGHADGALEAFDKALSLQPDYAHALWDKAGVLFDQKQDYAGAIAAWERFVRVAPPGPDRDQATTRIREAKTRLAAGPAPAGAKPPKP